MIDGPSRHEHGDRLDRVPQRAAAAGGMFVAYGVTHTVYEDGGSDGSDAEGEDFDFDFG